MITNVHPSPVLLPSRSHAPHVTRALRKAGLLIAALLSVSTIYAATITVSNTADSGAGSLRQAILDSADGDTIDFSVTGVITLTSGELLVSHSITISGPGAAELAVNGNAASRVFHTGGGIGVAISGLTIRNGVASGDYGGGILNDHATLTLTDCMVSGNSAFYGGGVSNEADSGGATLILTNTTLSGNSANSGAGIYSSGVSGTANVGVTNSTLSGNSASYGGGIYNYGYSGTATLTVINSTLSGNSATQSYAGGGIYNYPAPTATRRSRSGTRFSKPAVRAETFPAKAPSVETATT